MSGSDEDPTPNLKVKPESDLDDEMTTAPTSRGYDPIEAGRNAPYIRLYTYQEAIAPTTIDESLCKGLLSAMVNESMMRRKKGAPPLSRANSEKSSSSKKDKGEKRKRKKESEGGTDSKKYRMISSPSSSDSEDDKPLKPAAPAKSAILDLTNGGRSPTPVLDTSSEDEGGKSVMEGKSEGGKEKKKKSEEEKEGKRKRKEKRQWEEEERKKDTEKKRKKHEKHEQKNNQAGSSKVVDLFAGMEASGNAKRERRQKTWSDPNRISVIGWSNDRIMSHFKAFSHIYVNPMPKDKLEEALGGSFPAGDGEVMPRKKKERDRERDRDRDRDRERKKEKEKRRDDQIHNGDGSPVRKASIDSDDSEGDVVLPKREKKEKEKDKKHRQPDTRKCTECGETFSLADVKLNKDTVWCGIECIKLRVAKAFDAIENHDSKVNMIRSDGQVITDGPSVRKLEEFLKTFPEFVPMLPEKEPAPKPAPSAAKPPKVISKSSDTVRVGVRRAIGEALHSRVKKVIGCTFRMKDCKDVAEKLEFELFIANAQNAFNKEYKFWFGSFVKAVKSPMNKGFYARILAGLISAQRAVTLDEKAMMSEEYAAPLPVSAVAAGAANEAAATPGGDDDVPMEDSPSTSALVPKPMNAMNIKRIPKLPPSAVKPTSALDSILGDGRQNTTAQHNSHFYDANCDICAKKTKAAADRASREEMEKLKARDKREEHFRKIREAEKEKIKEAELQRNRELGKRSPSPDYGGGGGFEDDDYFGGGGGGGDSPAGFGATPRRPTLPPRFPALKGGRDGGRGEMRRSRSRSRERDRDGGRKHWGPSRHNARSDSPEDPWKSRSPLIWRGELSMISTITLVTLRAISNSASFGLRDFFPKDIKVKGRIQHLAFFDYLLTVRTANLKDICVFECIKPDTPMLEREFCRLVDDMNETKKYLVVNLDNLDMVKDGYLVPVAREEEVPAVLLPWAGPGVPAREDRRDMLLLVVTLQTKWVGPLPPPPPQLPPMSSFAEATEERLRMLHAAAAAAAEIKRKEEEAAAQAYSPSHEYALDGGQLQMHRRPYSPSSFGGAGGGYGGPPPPHGGAAPNYMHAPSWDQQQHHDEYERERSPEPVAAAAAPPALAAPPNLAYGAAADEEEGATEANSLLPPVFFELHARAAENPTDQNEDTVPVVNCLEDFLLALNSCTKPARVKALVHAYINNPNTTAEESDIAKNAVFEKINAERKKADEEKLRKEAEEQRAASRNESRPPSNGSAASGSSNGGAGNEAGGDSSPTRDRPFSPSDFDQGDVSFLSQPSNISSMLNTLRKDSNTNENDSADSSQSGIEGVNGAAAAAPAASVPKPVPPPVLPPGMSLPVPPPPPPRSDVSNGPPPPPPPSLGQFSSILPPPPPPPSMPSGVPQPVPPPSFASLLPAGLLPPPPPPPPPKPMQQAGGATPNSLANISIPPPHYSMPPPGVPPPNLSMPPPLYGGGGGMQQMQHHHQQQQQHYGMMGMQQMNMPPPPFGMPPGHMGMPPPLMGGGEHSMMEEPMEQDSGPLVRLGAAACPTPLDVHEILAQQQAQAAQAQSYQHNVMRGSAGFGSQLPPSMGGPPNSGRATTPELVARALDIRPLPQPHLKPRKMEVPENAADLAEFLKSKKDALLSNEGFMGDPTIKPLPRAAQERIQKMLQQQEMEEERARRREEMGEDEEEEVGIMDKWPQRRSRGGVKHRERAQKREQQARERANIELSKRMGVYETPLPGAPVAREVRPMPLMALNADPPPGFEGGRGNFDDDFGEEGFEDGQGPSGYGSNGRDGEGGDSPADDLNSSSMDISRDEEDNGGGGGKANNESSLLLPPPPPPPPMTPGGGFRGGRGGGPWGPPPPLPMPPGFRGGIDGGYEEREGGGRWRDEERGWNGNGGGEWEEEDEYYRGPPGPPRPLFDDYQSPMRGRGRGGPPPMMRGGRGRGGPPTPRGGGGRGGSPGWRGGRGGPGGFRGGPPPFRGGPPRGRGGPPPFRGGGGW